jgi:hypothetical protein
LSAEHLDEVSGGNVDWNSPLGKIASAVLLAVDEVQCFTSQHACENPK